MIEQETEEKSEAKLDNILTLFYKMQLTKLQTDIQEYADKTLSFGCLVNIGGTAFQLYSKYKYDGYYHLSELDCSSTSTIRRNHATEGIIGHPMNRGRLCYLNRKNFSLRTAWDFDTLEKPFKDNPELYQQTVLERPTDLQELVLKFLLTLPI